MSAEPIKVGDKLWYVPNERYHGQPHEVTIVKVGRRWAPSEGNYQPLRFDLTDLIADGGGYSSPGRAYRDKAAHEADIAIKKAWEGLVRRLRQWDPPKGVDLDWINAAHERLGIPK